MARCKVIISGAGGQTGQVLFRKMLALPDEMEPLGLVRTAQSRDALVESGIPATSIAVVDISDPDAVQQVVRGFVGDAIAATGETIQPSHIAFCICSSAKVKPVPGLMNPDTGRPILGFPDGSPEQVDWLGQKNQIDACPPGTHVVLCSSMGGTDPNHMLNHFGRETLPDGSHKGGNILKWKRKAEIYLIDKSNTGALTYTIVHPGGLVNEPGFQREIVVGLDDQLTGTESRVIPREDVAEVMLNAVRFHQHFKNRSFDIRAKPIGQGTPAKDLKDLLIPLNGRNCDYKLGETM